MSYQVTRGVDGRPSIVLQGEPPYCRALDAAPPAREPELDIGLWLVVSFPSWSVPDIAAIQADLDATKHFRGKLKLGLRPFDDPEEHATWRPELKEHGNGTLLLLLRDGKVCMKHQGLFTVDALIDAIEAASPRDGPLEP